MSKLEIVLIVCFLLCPIVAVIVIPKHKKEKKQPEVQTKTLEEYNKEQSDDTKIEPITEKKPDINFGTTQDDFKDFIKNKAKQLKSSSDLESREDFHDNSMPYSSFNQPKPPVAKQEKTIIDQIEELSPEMKAILLAGVLDRKDY